MPTAFMDRPFVRYESKGPKGTASQPSDRLFHLDSTYTSPANASSVNLTNVKYNTNIFALLLQERKMPSGEDEARGLSMTFPSTSRHHSGFYTCSADNGFGRASNATITLDVQRKC